VKRVPVPAGPGVRFADAPRLYRVPMKLEVATSAGVETREATLVLDRRGIARIAPGPESLPVSPLSLLEVELQALSLGDTI